MRVDATRAWIDRLLKAVRRDPKKSTVMAVLAVVMLGLWGRMLFGGPGKADGSLVKVLPSNKHTATASNPSRETAGDALLTWLNQKERPEGRNLFEINLNYYPREGGRAAGGARLDGNPWNEMDKSHGGLADHKTERKILVENLQVQAAKLELQSTVMSDPPRAIVNGQLVEEGNVIDSFQVLKIEPQRIIVEQQGVRLEISME